MQTPFFANLTSFASARRTADIPSLAAPVELELADLQHVSGGAPRGGWQSTSESALVTSDASVQAPRGGW